MRFALALPLAALFAIPASAQGDPDVTPQIRELHERAIVLDTHLDIPSRFDDGQWDFTERHHFDWDGSQVDLPRMIEGGLDGGVFVIYTGQGENTPEGYRQARDRALVRAAAIRRVIGENRDHMGLALTADDAERLAREGKRIAFLSIENSWPLGEDLSLLTTFYNLGVRMAGPVHSRDNQLADSTTGEGRWRGLSPLGRQWVAEMNRLGIIIDGSHSSDAAIDQMLELSRVPIVLSHHGPRDLYNHPRNTTDERLRRVAQGGGVIFMNTLFLAPDDRSPERSQIEERQGRWASLSPAERRQLLADKAALDARQRFTQVDFDLFMRSVMHVVRLVGADHVGLGADWDGGGGVIGMEDIALLPRITARLKREGLSDGDVEKILGGNLLRVMRQVQAGAARPAA
ncbi:dipeptidase [Sphingosinicella sp. LHD-64]|uniref:dipeptidase n=1 Tax=Sphingosinicella sp. LHD-64 TaxID=3072139 RepID=UPI00280E11F5|nr:dipeptidase [Sphingosinicella sp. LHD-64]MDQ8755896.1 dipeptidase [Sphingosinicella sp. LHD-64]